MVECCHERGRFNHEWVCAPCEPMTTTTWVLAIALGVVMIAGLIYAAWNIYCILFRDFDV